ncbi:AAA family ATPase [Haliangium sp.]|uniref:AAA family ATPase n=1 Tax=Haliangium sp. TaxID=2663208 RepID=UPI003D11FCE4
MIEFLELQNVGPAPRMELRFAPRVNLITGDNGLGKSFLLDAAWWALTRRWPQEVNPRMTSGMPARPRDPKKKATIAFQVTGKKTTVAYQATYTARDEAWTGRAGRPWNPGLVVYAHSDGAFSVWDPARNYWKKKGNIDIQERLPAYVFTEPEVWNGLRADVDGRSMPVCNGLLYDWSSWIKAKDDNAQAMEESLRALSSPHEPAGVLTPGPLKRLSVNDARDIPTLATTYAGDVPILHASSGVRRVAALAYMLIWSWNEHRLASEQLGEEPTRQVIMLFDEVESHLHPRWQRVILKALRDLVGVLHTQAEAQLIVASHSPLVLASAEPWFDPEQDAWFDLDLEGQPPEVQLRRRPYTLHGTAGHWLTSEAFDLATDRGSVEAERAILRARELTRRPEVTLREVMDAHKDLRAVLPDVDAFWVRWNAFVEAHGGTP